MMNWLLIKQILQKVWFYVKNYWWVGSLVALGFFLHKFFLYDKDVFLKLYEDKAKQNEKELKVLNDAQQHEREEKERVRTDHKLLLNELEAEKEKSGEKVKKEEKKRLKQVLEMPKEERAIALADEFGFEIVEVEE